MKNVNYNALNPDLRVFKSFIVGTTAYGDFSNLYPKNKVLEYTVTGFQLANGGLRLDRAYCIKLSPGDTCIGSTILDFGELKKFQIDDINYDHQLLTIQYTDGTYKTIPFSEVVSIKLGI
jgi:hypothetical protein